MPSPRITAHAIERYRERVADLTDEAICIALCSPTVLTAIEFGAPFVRLATRQRIVIEDGAVVTVLPADTVRGRLDRRRRNATGARRCGK